MYLPNTLARSEEVASRSHTVQPSIDHEFVNSVLPDPSVLITHEPGNDVIRNRAYMRIMALISVRL